jgi:hypothetical protein
MTAQVSYFKPLDELARNISTSNRRVTNIDSARMEECLLDFSTDADYDDFTKETGLFISDVELMRDESIYISWIHDNPNAPDDHLIWEFYFHFLYDRYQEELDPENLFDNPFLSYIMRR